MISVCGVIGYTPLQQPRAPRLASPAATRAYPAAWLPVTSGHESLRHRLAAGPHDDRAARTLRGAQAAALAVVVVEGVRIGAVGAAARPSGQYTTQVSHSLQARS